VVTLEVSSSQIGVEMSKDDGREIVKLSDHRKPSDGEHNINRMTQERADKVREDIENGDQVSDGR